MKNTFFYLFFFVFVLYDVVPANAQDDTAKKRRYGPVAADCDKAIPLNIAKRTTYGPTLAPQGFGEKQEIVSRVKNSNTAFEKEHNSAWYLLTMESDGELTFEVTPQDSSNDYDFILYACTDSASCLLIQQGKIKPVRSNIRRNDTGNKGVTGLARDAKNELQAQGPGIQFSKSLMVKKGQRYMLVLDNVYEGGKGHKLDFHYMKDITVAGVVSDDEGKKVKADIVLSDTAGRTVAETKSNDSGIYTLSAHVAENTRYVLTFSAEHSFFATKTVNTLAIKDSSAMINIRAILPRLKKGKKYKMGDINFYGNSPVMLPGSVPYVEALHKLMKKNSKMIIRIEGHVNMPGIYDSTNENYQKLSEWRARTVYDYLLENGIEQNRMSTIGYSNRFMLYPEPKNWHQMEANRRVEINVISLGDRW